ncbi:hypothetical protein BTVI_68788 [Pitangus sulphuratus]|nr:hypothetical protein BTVI_68788 [Pitangus sulphuratus]
MRHDAPQGERAALWESGGFEGLNSERQPAPDSPRLLTFRLVLSHTCLITVDLSDDLDSWLNLVTVTRLAQLMSCSALPLIAHQSEVMAAASEERVEEVAAEKVAREKRPTHIIQVVVESSKVYPEPPFLQAKQPQLPQKECMKETKLLQRGLKILRLANWDKTSDKYSESHVEIHFGNKGRIYLTAISKRLPLLATLKMFEVVKLTLRTGLLA